VLPLPPLLLLLVLLLLLPPRTRRVPCVLLPLLGRRCERPSPADAARSAASYAAAGALRADNVRDCPWPAPEQPPGPQGGRGRQQHCGWRCATEKLLLIGGRGEVLGLVVAQIACLSILDDDWMRRSTKRAGLRRRHSLTLSLSADSWPPCDWARLALLLGWRLGLAVPETGQQSSYATTATQRQQTHATTAAQQQQTAHSLCG
jgi:hypothetical protein